MANGKPGDHPYTDIVVHGLTVCDQETTQLVQEITRHGDGRVDVAVRNLLWFMDPQRANESWRKTVLDELKSSLRGLRDVCEELARARK